MYSRTHSIWMNASPVLHFKPLERDIKTTVCVVGGGIAGLTTAYLLAQEGQHVVVIDADAVGAGETERTTAHLSTCLERRYFELEPLHGREYMRLAAQSHAEAIDIIESIHLRERINCNFQRLHGYLFTAGADDPTALERELAAAQNAGIEGIHRVGQVPCLPWTGAALCFPNQAQFHPMKYISGLLKPLTRGHVQIFEKTRAVEFHGTSVKTAHGPVIEAKYVVVATHTPINDLLTLHTKLANYRSYAVGFSVPRFTFPKVLAWDLLDPYHYLRFQADPSDPSRDIVIVGGEDHKTGQEEKPEDRISKLADWTKQRFANAGPMKYQWSGQIVQTIDGLAYIGRNPGQDNVFVITGDSGSGMTYGTLGAKLVCDQILGRANRWAQVYDPFRRNWKASREYLKENLNTGAQYADWFRGGTLESTDEIKPDSGALVREGVRLIAAYRDSQDNLHEFSAACPHLGGVVQWNEEEKSWDCPCHGSRFSCTGEVIHGPATRGLHPAHEDDWIPGKPVHRRDEISGVEL